MAGKLKTYTEEEAQAKIGSEALDGWYLEDGWLKRKYSTANWRTTLMLVTTIGYLCEAGDHHADVNVTYAKLWVKLKTHSEKAITDKDFELAKKIERL